MEKKEKKMEEYRAKLELDVQEVDALDDLIDSYIEGEED